MNSPSSNMVEYLVDSDRGAREPHSDVPLNSKPSTALHARELERQPTITTRASRILMVDDDFTIREVFSEALIRSGYKVDTAEDGEAGWQALLTHCDDFDRYDALITDNDMPKLSGVELVRRLRAEGMIVPVILASGSVLIDIDRLQVEVVLRKPFSTGELVQKVKEVLGAPPMTLAMT